MCHQLRREKYRNISLWSISSSNVDSWSWTFRSRFGFLISSIVQQSINPVKKNRLGSLDHYSQLSEICRGAAQSFCIGWHLRSVFRNCSAHRKHGVLRGCHARELNGRMPTERVPTIQRAGWWTPLSLSSWSQWGWAVGKLVSGTIRRRRRRRRRRSRWWSWTTGTRALSPERRSARRLAIGRSGRTRQGRFVCKTPAAAFRTRHGTYHRTFRLWSLLHAFGVGTIGAWW